MRIGALTLTLALAVAGFRFFSQEPAGNRAYRDGDYERAAELYREALADGRDDARLRHNLGIALLRLGEVAAARQHLSKALEARSPELRARAFYNLGNAMAVAASDRASAGDGLREAIEAYRRSLLLKPDQEDARWNLELAMRRLQKLESLPPRSSQEERRAEGPEGPAGEAGDRPSRLGGEAPTPDAGSGRTDELAGRQTAIGPLPPDLAEQILRAVEEQERGLQREKLRRSKKRGTGPDW